MGTFFSSLVVKWWLRRFMELGGIVGTGLSVWNGLPETTQGVILLLLSRNWDSITLGSLIPVGVALWGYVWSYLSTNKSQVVVDGQQVPLKELPAAKATTVEQFATTAIEKRGNTLWDMLSQKIGKK